MPLTVTLSHAPNPDVAGGYWEEPVESGRPRCVRVADLDQAAAVCLAYIARNALGGGNWTGGGVVEEGRSVARVSYNGRVWPTEAQGAL